MKRSLLCAGALLLTLAACGQERALVAVSVQGLPAEIQSLRVTLSTVRLRAVHEVTESLSFFGFFLPEGSDGDLQVSVTALQADRCYTFSGSKSATVAGQRRIDLTISLANQGVRTCPLDIEKAGAGSGRVQAKEAAIGINCGQTCQVYLAIGTVVQLLVAPDPPDIFLGWSESCGMSADCQVTTSGPLLLRATFVPNLLLVEKVGTGAGRVLSDLPGIDCGAQCSATFPAGAQVRLLARPNAGVDFSGWSGACQGTGQCVITASGMVRVTAAFAPQ